MIDTRPDIMFGKPVIRHKNPALANEKIIYLNQAQQANGTLVFLADESRDFGSRYMNKVKAGERMIVMDRKKEVAVIMPLENRTQEEKINQLIRRRKAAWSGGKPEGMPTRIVSRVKKVSDAVIEDRR